MTTPLNIILRSKIVDSDIPKKDKLQAEDLIIDGSLKMAFDTGQDQDFGLDSHIIIKTACLSSLKG
jgi:hypothetical protein